MDSKKTLRRKYKMIKKVKELMGEKKLTKGKGNTVIVIKNKFIDLV